MRREGLGMRGEGRGSKRTEHKIPSVLGWMAHFFSLKREALNPICASCQLCPRVPGGGGRKSGKWLISFTVGQVRAGLTCAGMGFVWLRTGQKWMCNTVAMTKGLKLNWIPILLFSILLPSLPAFFVSNLDGEKRERSWCVKEKLGY